MTQDMDYTGRRWRALRARVLRKQPYCLNCLRYGKSVEASTAHHAWPSESYPEYRWCEWNLVPLCATCHDRMHERNSRQLTALGEYWRRKRAPPL